MTWQSPLPRAEEATQHSWVREETDEIWVGSVEDNCEWVSESEVSKRRRESPFTQRRGRRARGEDAKKSLEGWGAAADMTERAEAGDWSWVWV